MCYEEGVWQAYLDKELDFEEEQLMRKHLQECDNCQSILQELEAQNSMVAELLGQYQRETQKLRRSSSLGWDLFIEKEREKKQVKRGIFSMNHIKRLASGKAVAAMLLVALGSSFAFAPVRSAAAQFLQIFRAERLTMVSLSVDELREMQQAISAGVGEVDLAQLGKIEFTNKIESKTVGINDVRSNAEFPVKIPSYLPTDYKFARAEIEQSFGITFNLDVEKVNQVIRSLGGEKLLPQDVAGKSFTVMVPQVVSLVYNEDDSKNSISVIQSKSPRLNVPGDVDVPALREAVLELPVLPKKLKKQLTGIKDWQRTAVIPTVEGEAREVTVNGGQGIFIQSSPSQEVEVQFKDSTDPDDANIEVNGQQGTITESGSVSSVTLIWQENETVYMLNGPLDLDAALEIAESMK